jgi:cellobiose-specific phosphotransferase system component IIC
MGKIKPQIVMFFIAALAKIPLSIGLFSLTGSWAAIVLVNALLYLPMCVFMPIIVWRDILRVEREALGTRRSKEEYRR